MRSKKRPEIIAWLKTGLTYREVMAKTGIRSLSTIAFHAKTLNQVPCPHCGGRGFIREDK